MSLISFTTKQANATPLFQLDAEDVKIDLKERQTYRYPIHDCVVELWKKGDRVYVLIV